MRITQKYAVLFNDVVASFLPEGDQFVEKTDLELGEHSKGGQFPEFSAQENGFDPGVPARHPIGIPIVRVPMELHRICIDQRNSVSQLDNKPGGKIEAYGFEK